MYVGAALPPLTKNDRRCYYSLAKVTMICRGATNRPDDGKYIILHVACMCRSDKTGMCASVRDNEVSIKLCYEYV